MAVSVIASSGGDYTSLSAWEAAVQGVLSEIQEAECEAFADTTACTIDGSTTTSSFYHRIYAAAGAEAQMPWSTGRYRLSTSANTLILSDDHIRVERIQVENNETTVGRSGIRVFNTGCRLDGVYVKMAGSGATTKVAFNILTPSASSVVLRNCVASGCNQGVGFDVGISGTGTVRFYNCTGYANQTNFRKQTGNGIAKNCLGAAAATADFSGTWAAGTEYNASSDGTAPGTNSRTSQTFTFVNAAGGDYHLASGDGGARDFGVDLSADASFPFSTDFDGATRSGTWDIGADEHVAVGGGASPLLLRLQHEGLFVGSGGMIA